MEAREGEPQLGTVGVPAREFETIEFETIVWARERLGAHGPERWCLTDVTGGSGRAP